MKKLVRIWIRATHRIVLEDAARHEVGYNAQFGAKEAVDVQVPGLQVVQGPQQRDHLLRLRARVRRRHGHRGARSLCARLLTVCNTKHTSSCVCNCSETFRKNLHLASAFVAKKNCLLSFCRALAVLSERDVLVLRQSNRLRRHTCHFRVRCYNLVIWHRKTHTFVTHLVAVMWGLLNTAKECHPTAETAWW